ncbi:MAG TPA: hypothetical protein VFJ74_09275 [Gemmatimonadaceae bacterium]|nr:hypothetical protein [Gemmatimonadaceae bacterium]
MTALFVNLLLVQLLLVGTGASCVDRASTMSADQGAMSAAQMATGHDAATASGSCSSDCAAGGSSSSHAPCGMPSSAPGGGGTCQQMSSCAAPMIVPSPAPLVASLDPTRAAVASALVPPGTTPAPDVPPPRV